MPPLLYISRHGQTDWNVEERLQGQADTDINAVGRAQADDNGRRLAGLLGDPAAYDYVASPLRRTCETMQRIRVQLGLSPEGYVTDPRLKEVHFGSWQGFTYPELEEQEPGCTLARTRTKWEFLPPGPEAESYVDLAQRVCSWLESLERPTICVTHGGVMRTVFHLVGGMSPHEAVEMHIPQDRVLRVKDGGLEWL
ncbi:histidine phosphatase family protein [Chelativorans sp. M5D2P16]|uniref:histidine phosphatase family protein n=1 Tax=Chelativorans sp. M5D2P16 TaxID=3095678 RepID=UPI002ACA21D5|nr:histidine phosphatase family protein [Chelativorans sp. M5D2P16]MDZ5698849.1 histidine phosphatase family protein [Chelativorans sp. M5D2P16]